MLQSWEAFNARLSWRGTGAVRALNTAGVRGGDHLADAQETASFLCMRIMQLVQGMNTWCETVTADLPPARGIVSVSATAAAKAEQHSHLSCPILP